MHALVGARSAGEAFLGRGITRWEAEGRLAPSEVAWLRHHLSTPEVADALRHLGAHLVLSAIPVPIPGLRSAARFTWTLGFWGISSARRLRYRTTTSHRKLSNIHSPLVMVLALIPGFGAAAYLAASPLRKKLLVQLMVDQIAWKLPFTLYRRLHLSRWLAPSPGRVELSGGSSIPSEVQARRLLLSVGRDQPPLTRGEESGAA